MDYSTLISKITSNEPLFKGIMSDIPTELSYLNLITADWETQLENNAYYQDFSTKSKFLWKSPYENEVCCYEESKIPNFNVIVVGYCKFVKPFKNKPYKPGVFVSNCDPLKKIALAMTSDLDPSIQLSNDFKFNFMDCSRLTCNLCNDAAEMFAKNGYTMDQLNQPCISETKVFDGKRVVNRFQSQMQSMFSQTFLAVMFLQIYSRYSYNIKNQKEHRISGNIFNIIGFNESKLTLNKKIDIGHLVKFTPPEKPQEETDFITELMSEKQSTTKQSNDNIVPEKLQEGTGFLTELMLEDNELFTTKQSNDNIEPEKLQEGIDFPTESMLEDNEQPTTKRSADDTIEPPKKILKTNNLNELDFLSEIMQSDSFQNAQSTPNLELSDDDKTEELVLI